MKTKQQTTQSRSGNQWQELCDESEILGREKEAIYKAEFETVLKALYEMDPSQEEIYATHSWDLCSELPHEADAEKIQKALCQAGFADDEIFCKSFMKYANLTIVCKRNFQQQMITNLFAALKRHRQTQKTDDCDEWQFVPLHIIPPEEMPNEENEIIRSIASWYFIRASAATSYMNGMMKNFSQRENEIFASITCIPSDDVGEDDLAEMDAYEHQATFTNYLDELKSFEIIEDGEADAFLSADLTTYLFQTLKYLAAYIRDHTDEPEQAKEVVAATIKTFDRIRIFGLIFQILLLQGLFRWLEDLDFETVDVNFEKAQSCYDWLKKLLLMKLIDFCFIPFSDDDKKHLEPFCSYLYATETGKMVQHKIFKEML